jgi:hypothetical protein
MWGRWSVDVIYLRMKLGWTEACATLDAQLKQ